MEQLQEALPLEMTEWNQNQIDVMQSQSQAGFPREQKSLFFTCLLVATRFSL